MNIATCFIHDSYTNATARGVARGGHGGAFATPLIFAQPSRYYLLI